MYLYYLKYICILRKYRVERLRRQARGQNDNSGANHRKGAKQKQKKKKIVSGDKRACD